MEFEVDVFSNSDAPGIAELEAECFTIPWSERAVLEQFIATNAVCFVARALGQDMKVRLLGYVGAYYVLDEGYITNLAVWPEMQGYGIGKALLQRMLQEGLRRGLVFLTLEVRASNFFAIGLYESCGFEKQGVRKDFYSKPSEDAVLMTRFLKG